MRRALAQSALLALAELLAMAPWFAATPVARQIAAAFDLSSAGAAWLTISVQGGFVVGALISALANLADRAPARWLFAVSALLAAACTAALSLPGVSAADIFALRFLTGAFLAGVYPPGMKLIASWTIRRRGLAIGALVAALTVGSALPHLLTALVDAGAGAALNWRQVALFAAGITAIGAAVCAAFVRPGPFLPRSSPFNVSQAGAVLRDQSLRLATLGYLGHMWELYAMWAWAPALLFVAFERAGWSSAGARTAGFSVIAIGAVGCVGGGALADRLGRTRVAAASMIGSGLCALIAGSLVSAPAALLVVCLIWGVLVIADSAQFSAAVSELADPAYIGTALTMQTLLGFLLTMLTIRLVPTLVERFDWPSATAALALGPAVGTVAMLRLRRLPEAVRLAGGKR